ncbi:MAG: hypothetical protein ACFE9M_06260 [Promethearchaeota archaeon]
MYKRYGYLYLVRFAFLKLIISLILFLINLILILWINNTIVFNDIIYRGLFIFLSSFEGLRILIMFMCGILTLGIEKIDIKLKVAIITPLLFGIGFNIFFLIRLFGFACFTPVYSFACMIFIIASFVLIIIQEHDNNNK